MQLNMSYTAQTAQVIVLCVVVDQLYNSRSRYIWNGFTATGQASIFPQDQWIEI